jgi:hypothetical protein
MRVLLVEHDSTYSVRDVPEKQTALLASGVEEEIAGERLPVFIRDLNSALNEYFIARLRKIYPAE